MPKDKDSKKKRRSSSASDDTSDTSIEDAKPPKKQQKKGASSSSSKAKSDDNEFVWSLDKNRQVTVREYRGKVYVDIREYYLDANGDLKPGKKGISLSAPQYQKLKGLISEIDDALKQF